MKNDFRHADQQQQEACDAIAALAYQQSKHNHHHSFHSPGEGDHTRMHLDGNHKADEKDGRKEEDLFGVLEAGVEAEKREICASGVALAQLERDGQRGKQQCGGKREHEEVAAPATLAEIAAAEYVVRKTAGYSSGSQQCSLLVKDFLAKNQSGCEKHKSQSREGNNDPFGRCLKVKNCGNGTGAEVSDEIVW